MTFTRGRFVVAVVALAVATTTTPGDLPATDATVVAGGREPSLATDVKQPIVNVSPSATSSRPATGESSARIAKARSRAAATARPSPKLVAGRCPDPRTCGRYDLPYFDKGWKRDPDGKVRIRFYINTMAPYASYQPTEDDIEAAILAATEVWETASPIIDFIYMGRTDRYPRAGDGYNDFMFGGSAGPSKFEGEYYVEGDVMGIPSAGNGTFWARCPQRDGACTPAKNADGSQELQDLMTHEIGHVLGLGDLGYDRAVSQLTMGYQEPEALPGDRRRQTLGLGDILGIRALYPCGCPLPKIYYP